ncbi:hypothetical protein BBOMB_0181 [Bifidobacterium bombi DSM 19703]|uniref:Uncharacterized protein n=1 Tax=Bifidobacterium bombi DSM 19703 TaxID=1341695 RepID=A0A080N5P6_9BIFI|nr:hypothetical protein BBOMB_0181 [Bifidobacterium bombi DSM 19703]
MIVPFGGSDATCCDTLFLRDGRLSAIVDELSG